MFSERFYDQPYCSSLYDIMINTSIIWDPEDIAPYRESWEQLFDGGSFEPSVSFEWTNALKNNHNALFARFFLVVIKRGNLILGIVPMIVKEEPILGQVLVTLSPISELYNTHSDFLIAEYSAELSESFVDTLMKLPCRWDLFRVTRMLEGHPFFNSLTNALTTRRVKYRTRFEQPSFFLELDHTFEAYLSKRSSKFRNFLKRAQKKLDLQGKVNFIKVNETNDFEQIYSSLLKIEKDSWKHAHGTAISSVHRQTGFYQDLCRAAQKTGRLHLMFLLIDNVPVAYDMGLIHGEQYSYLKTSYIHRLKPFSPATVLRARLIETLVSEGIRHFDFPGEPHTWEKQWTDDLRWHKSIVAFNKTVKAQSILALSTVKDLLRGSAMEKQLIYHEPRDLKSPGN